MLDLPAHSGLLKPNRILLYCRPESRQPVSVVVQCDWFQCSQPGLELGNHLSQLWLVTASVTHTPLVWPCIPWLLAPKYGMGMCTLSQRIAVDRLSVCRWLLYVSRTKFTGIRSCLFTTQPESKTVFLGCPLKLCSLDEWMTSFCIIGVWCEVTEVHNHAMFVMQWTCQQSQLSLPKEETSNSVVKHPQTSIWSARLWTPERPAPALCVHNYHKQFLSTCDLLKRTHWLPMWLLTELLVSTREP